MDKKGLGRGLSALLADVAPAEDHQAAGAQRQPDGTQALPIELIRPNPNQPRRRFGEKELEDLTASIRERGVIQPLIVRPHPTQSGAYEIVAGERRWRAAQRAGLHALPALVRELDDTEVIELAIIENVQRTDLNPVEEALGYRQLMDRFGHTQERLAEGLGKSRSHIANLLRLLTLPEAVLVYLREGRLTAGHARALVTSPDPLALAKHVIERDLSVRQTEQLSRQMQTGPLRAGTRRQGAAKDADTRALEADLAAALRLKVVIDHRPGGQVGELRIRYSTLEELDGLCQLLTR